MKYVGILKQRKYIYTFKAFEDKYPLDFVNDTPSYWYINDMKHALKNNTVHVIRKFSNFLVLGPQAFIKLWIEPLRLQWLVQSPTHRLAHQPYQFINTPIGDVRVAAAYLGGKQCYVKQEAEYGTFCASFAVISQAMIYRLIKSNNTQVWIRIIDTAPSNVTEPIFMVSYQEIYEFSDLFMIFLGFIYCLLVCMIVI